MHKKFILLIIAISSISVMLGINNVDSYMRFFKAQSDLFIQCAVLSKNEDQLNICKKMIEDLAAKLQIMQQIEHELPKKYYKVHCAGPNDCGWIEADAQEAVKKAHEKSAEEINYVYKLYMWKLVKER